MVDQNAGWSSFTFQKTRAWVRQTRSPPEATMRWHAREVHFSNDDLIVRTEERGVGLHFVSEGKVPTQETSTERSTNALFSSLQSSLYPLHARGDGQLEHVLGPAGDSLVPCAVLCN